MLNGRSEFNVFRVDDYLDEKSLEIPRFSFFSRFSDIDVGNEENKMRRVQSEMYSREGEWQHFFRRWLDMSYRNGGKNRKPLKLWHEIYKTKDNTHAITKPYTRPMRINAWRNFFSYSIRFLSDCREIDDIRHCMIYKVDLLVRPLKQTRIVKKSA